MRLVVLAALDLAFYRWDWMFILYPPITLLATILNLTLYWCWVRRRRITLPLLGSFFTGLTMALVIALYLAVTRIDPVLAR